MTAFERRLVARAQAAVEELTAFETTEGSIVEINIVPQTLLASVASTKIELQKLIDHIGANS